MQKRQKTIIGLGAAAAVLLIAAVLIATQQEEEEHAPRSLMSVRLVLPEGTQLVAGDRLHGFIGGFPFEGTLGAAPTSLQQGGEQEQRPRLRIATSTQSLDMDPSLAAAQVPLTTTSLADDDDSEAGNSVSFTADSNTYYPPGTVVSGYVNGKYFRGVVSGQGESEEKRFNRRVKDLETRIGTEEWRRGIRKQNDARIAKVINRIKDLEKRMNNAYQQSEKPKLPTLIKGNVVGFHFHGSLEPASAAAAASAEPAMLAEQPSSLGNQMSAQKQLLARVENLEKEVKQAS